MLELAAAQVEKGVFQMKLEGAGPKWAGWAVGLGPIRTRVLALSLIIIAGLLNLTFAPAHFIMGQGWAENTLQAIRYQATFKWFLAALGVFVWALAFFIRKEELRLEFDRAQNKMRYKYNPQWSLSTLDEGELPFEDIRRIEVFSAQKNQEAPYGYMELEVFDSSEKAEKLFRFKLLTDDQLKIYPANLSRITGREPIGDWVDPDSLPQG